MRVKIVVALRGSLAAIYGGAVPSPVFLWNTLRRRTRNCGTMGKIYIDIQYRFSISSPHCLDMSLDWKGLRDKHIFVS
jgi:hypothetical protein